MRDANLAERAKALRREATPPERAVWHVLRAPPFDALHFRRQVAFRSLYIADFASHRAKVIVEVDGRSHDGRHRPMRLGLGGSKARVTGSSG